MDTLREPPGSIVCEQLRTRQESIRSVGSNLVPSETLKQTRTLHNILGPFNPIGPWLFEGRVIINFLFYLSPNGTTQSMHKNMMILKFLALYDDF